MKLQELAVVSPTKQAAKVFESYFGDRIPGRYHFVFDLQHVPKDPVLFVRVIQLDTLESRP